MLKLKEIYLRNWCRTTEASLKFPDHGLVYLHGINSGVADQTSNGAGKTALGEAINRTLLGESLSTSLAAYSTNRKGQTLVRIHATLREKDLVVEMGYKADEFPEASGEGLRFSYDGGPWEEYVDYSDTRKKLSAMIGVSPAVSMWTVFLDGVELRFNRLSQQESLNLLMQALAQPPWESLKKRALQYREEKTQAVLAAATKLEEIKSACAALEALAQTAAQVLQEEETRYAQALKSWTVQQSAHAEKIQQAAGLVTAAADRCKALRREIQDVQKADAEANGKIELELSRLHSDRRVAEKHLKEWTKLHAEDSAAIRHSENHLKLLREGKRCPACKQPTLAAAGLGAIDAAEKEDEKLLVQFNESKAGVDKTEQCIAEIDEDIAKQQKARANLQSSRLETLSLQLETEEHKLSRAQSQLHLLEQNAPPPPSDEKLRKASAVRDERTTRWQEKAQQLDSAAAAVTQAERQAEKARYWVKGFSAEGVPNLVLRRAIAPLNEIARMVSTSMSGGLVSVSFRAETELASGEMRPRLITEINTLNGATEFARNSKGEGCFANLIIAEIQTRIGQIMKKVGYRWLDEVANPLSDSARRTLYTNLRRQAQDHQILAFVVDHHPQAAACADYTLIAEKSNSGQTTYCWG